jgi:hypothetical protein
MSTKKKKIRHYTPTPIQGPGLAMAMAPAPALALALALALGALMKHPRSERPSNILTPTERPQHNVLGFTTSTVTIDLKVDGLFVHP